MKWIVLLRFATGLENSIRYIGIKKWSYSYAAMRSLFSVLLVVKAMITNSDVLIFL